MRRVIESRPEPQLGDTRTVSRFLWLPLTLPRRDGVQEQRWLEHARIVQRYSTECYDFVSVLDRWDDVQWADKPEQTRG